MGLDEEKDLINIAAKKAGWKSSEIAAFFITRRSIDARKKSDIKLVFSVELSKSRESKAQRVIKTIKKSFDYPPIVVGFGPAGIFAAHTLALSGANPVVIERGDNVDARRSKVASFWQNGELCVESNVQFGEGGAGAFSDGKLNTGTGDNERQKYVLNTLINFGAPKNIEYDNKPHIGTDKLGNVVKAMREDIIARGGKVYFNTKVTDIIATKEGVKVICGDKEYVTRHLILALGHSARDTHRMLHDRGFEMEAKAFAVGMRIEHLQKDIDRAMYGESAGHPALGSADYKLVKHTGYGGVYSFCMCPGGYVIASSSENGTVVTNGMSNNKRDGINANSAILAGVTPKDFGEGLFDGLKYQEALERKAYDSGGGGFYAPCQLLGDFLKGRQSASFGKIQPTYKPGTRFSRLDNLFGAKISNAFREAFVGFDNSIRGFSAPDAVLTGVETRSSSSLRVLRGEDYASVSSKYVFPCGEGCGYAGGIMSSAVDGMRIAEKIIDNMQ
ncbi:MAG: hypothetical protein EOM87_05075 [Clostridia bacterium]|nr:hypothetical protein [Clostridia bacterium]